MIPTEILEKIRRIEIAGRRRSDERMAGEYHSVFKGQGMEFNEVRGYVPGDDIRSIDWNVTARAGEPFIKTYVEERERTVIFMVDASASASFGTRGQAKGELAAEITAVLALSAIANHDRVGLLAFTDRIEHHIPPRKGRAHVLRLVRDILFHKPQSTGTDLNGALETLMRVQKRRAIVFLLSDFQDREYDRALRMAARRHDLIAAVLSDPAESALPSVGLIELEDAESGARRLADSSDFRLAEHLSEYRRREADALRKRLLQAGVDALWLATDRPYERELMQFFQRRLRKMSH